MLLRLLLLFTVVPAVELMLLIRLSQIAGWWFTLGLVLGTGVVGTALARHEGFRWARGIREEIDAGRLPGDPLVDGVMILVAGVLLVTPGVLTDLLGFALLLPAFRRVVKRWLTNRFRAHIRLASTMHGWPPPNDESNHKSTAGDVIIDARVIDVPPEEGEEER